MTVLVMWSLHWRRILLIFTNDEISRTETCIVGITGGTVVNGLLELLNSPEYIERLNWERIFFLSGLMSVFASVS